MREGPILFSGPMIRRILSDDKTQTRRVIKRLRAQPRHDVTSDFAELLPGAPLSADARWVYDVNLNPQGAVAARLGSDKSLGLKPGEFDFLCPYADGHTYLRTMPDGRKVWTIKPHESRLWVKETYALGLTWERSPPNEIPCLDSGDRVRTWYRADADENVIDGRGRWRPSIHMPRWASRITLEVLGVRVERLQDITLDDCEAEGVVFPPAARSVANFAQLWDSINGERPGCSWASNPWVWCIEFRRVEDGRAAA